MPYALGIELGAKRVRLLVSPGRTGTPDDTDSAVAEPITEIPPILFVDRDDVVVGPEAMELARRQPAGLVADVVGQFTVDRLWLSGGRMLTPDDAMWELLAGVMRSAAAERGEPPYSVTIASPGVWEPDVAGRFAAIVDDIPLPRPNILPGVDVAAASTDAASRLPAATPVVDSDSELEERPQAGPTIERVSFRPAPRPDLAPIRARRRAPTIWGAAAAVGGLLIVLVASVALAGRRSEPGETTVATTPLEPTENEPNDTVPPTPLILGVLTNGSAGPAVDRARVEIAGGGGVWGREVVVTSLPAGGDPAAAATQLAGQGAVAIVTDEPADVVRTLGAAGGGGEVAICGPDADVAAGSGTTVVGGVFECTVFLSLAAERAGSLASGRIAEAARDLLTNPGGLACAGFRQCRDFIHGGQPIDYRPFGQPLRLATNE